MLQAFKKFLLVALGLFTGFTAASLAIPAFAVSGSATAVYAARYAANGSDAHNPDYNVLPGTDCANFASQALHAGGLAMDKTGSTTWYYQSGLLYPDFSKSWSHVGDLVSYLSTNGYISSTTDPTMSLRYSGAAAGDLYLYDWGTGQGWSHVAVALTDGVFANFYDSHYGKNYNTVTSGYGSRIAQHTTDRYNAPWNWGYHTETRVNVLIQMHTRVIHIN